MFILKMTAVLLVFSLPFVLLIAYVFWSVKTKRRKFWIYILDIFEQKRIEVISDIPADKKDLFFLVGTFGKYGIMVNDKNAGSHRHKIIFTNTEITMPNHSIPNFSIARWGDSNVKTGNQEFDKLFKIHSNEVDKTKKLFTDKIISEFLSRKNQFIDGGITCVEDKLSFTVPKLVVSERKKRQYSAMFDLTIILLNR